MQIICNRHRRLTNPKCHCPPVACTIRGRPDHDDAWGAGESWDWWASYVFLVFTAPIWYNAYANIRHIHTHTHAQAHLTWVQSKEFHTRHFQRFNSGFSLFHIAFVVHLRRFPTLSMSLLRQHLHASHPLHFSRKMSLIFTHSCYTRISRCIYCSALRSRRRYVARECISYLAESIFWMNGSG